MDQQDRFRGCLLGLAVGDAIGTSVEFKPRRSFEPVTDMTGGGPFNLQAGQWTDDTAMALCLATSLVECRGFDARDQMDRYLRWAKNGYLSSTRYCFDIGRTVAGALARYQATDDPYAGSTDPFLAGNGSIMRLAPVAMFYCSDIGAVEHHAADSSRTTHAAPECVDACRLLGRILCRALRGEEKAVVVGGEGASFKGAPAIMAIAKGQFQGRTAQEIHGSGYVVESLEAALWCFTRTDSYRDAVLAAANLGDDADTTAAVCGQVAGAYYGAQRIPAPWLDRLAMREQIVMLADGLGACTQRTIAD
jgi:ADP-ribosyl-[dinitrogen reductase] hydrolase